MIYNTTEQDSAEGITEYKEKPTWMQTMNASMKNFTSVSLTTSSFNYYNDNKKETMASWKEADPANENLYDRVGTLSPNILEKLDSLYEDGNYEAIENWNSMGTGRDFLKYKKQMETFGLRDTADIRDEAEFKSYNDYIESAKVLEESDYLSAKLIGTMGGALQDPVTLATLPIGTWKTGATVLGTAGRAFLEEAAIETAAQGLIVPITYAYKQQIGINTTIKDEAYNAIASIATAGLIRGTGSAAFDLTSNGIKALKVKDPELGAEYELLAKSNVSEDMDSHINELYRAEFGEQGQAQTAKPNEAGRILNEQEPIPEFTDIQKLETDLSIPMEDLQVVIGKDIEGNLQTTSYKEIVQELDDNDIMFSKIEDCILKGVS